MRYLNLILMAAGNSSRYGANKLLTDVGGKPMYRHVFDHLWRYQHDHPAICRLIVVSQYDEILAEAVRAGSCAIRNDQPQAGISRTIRLGLAATGYDPVQEAAITSPDEPGQAAAGNPLRQADSLADRVGAVFFTADQPALRAATIDAFLQAAHTTAGGILSAACGGQSGNPVAFDQRYFPELLALQGDRGGKQVMNRHLDDVTWFEIPASELHDIDRPQDWQSLDGQI